jgi:hypothetical protein
MLFESDSYVLGNKTEDVSCQAVGVQHADILSPFVDERVQNVSIKGAREAIERWEEHVSIGFFSFQQDA